MDIKKILAGNVRRYRLELGITQEKLSIEMGVDRAYISKIERALQNMTIVRLVQLADELKVEPALLITPHQPPQGDD